MLQPEPDSPIIDLTPHVDASGAEVWRVADGDSTAERPEISPRITVSPDGVRLDADSRTLSRLPRERMASANWDRIIQTIQAQEAGRDTDDEVVVRPGGALDLVPAGQTGQQLSTVPKDRMAATPRSMDRAEIARLDPGGVEEWQFVDDPVLPGFTFVMRPVGVAFRFFTFRWSSGRWYVSPLSPAFDTLSGHESHILMLNVDGDNVPVVCKAQSSYDHSNLTDVRGTAGKFALYHSLRGHGYTPFSA